MAYEDVKHRPHAVHTGEEPENPITEGPESLHVTLDRWGPIDNLFSSMYDALQANWGESPSRTINRKVRIEIEGDERVPDEEIADRTDWDLLLADERDYIESCFAGKTLQQVLEGITFDFCLDGVSRAFTHQNVRTRLGAGFMQHGGRDNDWRHRGWTMPETIRRACVEDFNRHRGSTEAHYAMAEPEFLATDFELRSCINDWKPIDAYLGQKPVFDGDESYGSDPTLRAAIARHILQGRELYAALVDAGIPWQDARRVLFMGMQTYIHDQYNYLALQGMLANRLEHIMDWEHNCVAQLMLREIRMKCPPLLSKYLGSHSDKAQQAKFAGLESWPPDRKYPSPYDDCKTCGHAGSMHMAYATAAKISERYHPEAGTFPGEMVCGQCEREGNRAKVSPLHRFVPVDRLQRQHRAEQNPFFVLHPDSMAGGPIVWIPTNGQYPHEVIGAVGR